jgi:hypothetical protein
MFKKSVFQRVSLASAVILIVVALIGALAAAGLHPQSASGSAALQDAVPQGGGGPGPLTTGFNYQGQLKNSGAPVNGMCDFQFSLYDQSGTGAPPTGGTQFGVTESDLSVQVTNGLFNVTLNYSNEFGAQAFTGDLRYLQIAVRCPTGVGSYTTLSPRQPLSGTPFALGLRAGTTMDGTAYQNLKIQSHAVAGSNPAGVTGEILTAADGVGVYGSNSVSTANSTGMGVWGRVWTTNGWGVRGQAVTSGGGVLAQSGTGVGLSATTGGVAVSAPAIFAENTSTDGVEPAGIAIFAKNHGADATLVLQNAGNGTVTGDTLRSLNAAGTTVTFRVTNTGRVVTSAVQIYGGGDLAEQFQVQGSVTEPGTLMVIDDQNPGMLKPSIQAYDTRVAGVVSGAGGVNPGMTLQQNGVLQGDTTIAIAGRVYVKAEAFSGAIKPGDLLTTSNIPGTAMKASDRSLSQGAVVGKAMTGLAEGTGLVLVLINLQ